MANKGLEGPAFNPSQPYGRTFHGEGKPRKSDLECAFFQNGLYYNSDQKLVDNDHNRSMLETKTAPSTAAAEEESASPIPNLSGESDENVFRMALNLFTKLSRHGETPDYEPSVDAREDNIAFLARHS